MKKFLAILLAAMMLLATAGVAFAAEATGDKVITIKSDETGHKYQAYQIFTGKLSENGKTLTELEWGTGIQEDKRTELIELFVPATEENPNPTIDDLAAALNTSNVQAFVDAVSLLLTKTYATSTEIGGGEYTISGLPTGYYFVKDEDNSLGVDKSYTKYILELVQNVEVTPKTEGLSSVKKVEENSEANMAGVAEEAYLGGLYNDVADYTVGDPINFAIYTDLPSDENMKYYKTYPLTIHDKMSVGLTFDPSTLTVEVDGKKLEAGTDYTLNYEVDDLTTDDREALSDGCTFEVVITDLNTLLDDEADYTYTADAKVVVKYQAALNEKAVIGQPGNPNDSWVTFNNNPNVDENEVDTPVDQVVVFTYEIDVDKTDGKTAEKLEGVKFTLYKDEACTEAIYVDANDYVTTDTENGTSVLTTDENGAIAVKGLDEGTYWLKEIEAKDGYNELEAAVKIQLSAATNNTQTYEKDTPATAFTGVTATLTTSDDATATSGAATTGKVTIDVKNFSGATLPSTGGIGTTLFYMFGGIMAAGSALMLVVRRRADAEEE